MKSAQATRIYHSEPKARHIASVAIKLLSDMAGMVLIIGLACAVVFGVGLMFAGLTLITGVML